MNVLSRSDYCIQHFNTATRLLFLAHTTSCGEPEEGNLGLDDLDDDVSVSNDHLLQVCHNGEWGYVCNDRFNHDVDGEVVLQQLQCKTGGKSIKIVANNL